MKDNGYVVDSFGLPSNAPQAVADINERFLQVSEAYSTAQANLADLKEQKLVKVHEARVESIAARTTGSVPPKKTASMVEVDFDRKIAAAQDDIDALRAAVDSIGNELAEAVGAHKAEWLETLQALESDATGRFQSAMALMRSAVADLAVARCAPAWLESYSANGAKFGRQPEFAAQPLTVNVYEAGGPGSMDSFTSVEKVMSLVALIAKPSEPLPRRNFTKAERSFAGKAAS